MLTNIKIWGNYGFVFNIETKKYVRLGGYPSMKAISILKKNKEWYKRVNYIIKHNQLFGIKLKKYLIKKDQTLINKI